MRLMTVDFETFYDQDYSLSKMTTESYLRDPRFEIIGVSKKIHKRGDNTPAEWFSGTHDEVYDFLADDVPDWGDMAVLAHNTAFDGGILNWKYGVKPRRWLCSMSMARPKHVKTIGVSLDALSKHYGLGFKGHQAKDAKGKRRADFTPQELEDYGSYCVNDNHLCTDVFKIFAPETTELQFRTIDQALRMFIEPKFVIDRVKLEEYLEELRVNKEALLARVGGNDQLANFMSNPKFAEMLEAEGVKPPMKISKTTKKPTFAFAKTDKGLKDLLEHPNNNVQALVACRLGVKSTIEETRTRALIDISTRGTMPVLLNYWAAGTGRFSGGDGINPQNFKRGGKIRDALLAPAGNMVITADLSQIEARILAWLAQQLDLVEAFAQDRDKYSEFATEVYGFKVTKADKVERFVGKTCILGLGYGMGPPKLRETLRIGQGGISANITVDESVRIVQLYRTQHPRIRALWTQMQKAVHQMSMGMSGIVSDHAGITFDKTTITLPNGAKLYYPGLKQVDKEDSSGTEYIYYNRNKPTKIYGGLLTENIVQALAYNAIVVYMDKIAERYGPSLQVHDEVVVIVPEHSVQEAKAFIEATMSETTSWLPGVPIKCEVGVGVSYGQAK